MNWTCHECDKIIHGLRPEHCTVCHETFASTKAGDRHRVGSFQPYARRCLTTGEMVDAKLEQDSHGYWRIVVTAADRCRAENLRAVRAPRVPQPTPQE